jgi:muramoyltetrapeptide carboxypeptidase
MKRKKFISSALALTGWGLSDLQAMDSNPIQLDDDSKIVPQPLKKGDVIAILAPAGNIEENDILPMVEALKKWGYDVRLGKTIGSRFFTFGGTDEERLQDLQEMMDNPQIKAIWAARGGYGLVRILDRINLEGIKKNPKWMIGFSDITALHLHIFKKIKLQSIHAKMSHGFAKDPSTLDADQIASLQSIQNMLMGEKNQYKTVADPANRLGIASGVLIGGNLAVFQALIGSESDINTDHKILFLEDTGEYLYQLDRLFWALKRAGKLTKLKGLIIGGFSLKKDDIGEEFALSLKEIVLEKIKDSHFPVCFGFPVGHQKLNYALKCGAHYRLEVHVDGTSIQEIDFHP